MNMISASQEQRQTWNALAQAWEHWGDAFERGASYVSRALIDSAALKAGDHVLDVATGLGEPALSIAAQVGRNGHVTGIDISEEMIAVARRRLGTVTNVSFVAADAEHFVPDSRYQVVTSRFGLMFMPNRQACLLRLRDAMTPGGRLVFSTWSTPDKVPMISLAVGFFVRELDLPPPPPGKPNPFCMADERAVLAELDAAGFGQARCERIVAPFMFETLAEFVRFSRDLIPPGIGAAIAERASPERIAALWTKFAEAAGRFVRADGTVSLPSHALCFSAQR
ncbi:class I SAM-dependent methyltransferase [Paraburkholderia phenazinium]|jgi:ubiquinone/menaquinone biosynthesis C-methylase UbiE|uniref:Methyltransferase domain-containing protein n=1 Tax=Paraburkholderia phenazinium TaxID=60549 RepID=A0A1G8M2Z0_9BURK|nr:methyltransferase domain-containing protein [Paraburkholderia phenazinium]SDI62329.1 Methyltransferase domain-containing protein [Paraburkholderia phenazinium]